MAGDLIPFPIAIADGVTARLHSVEAEGLVESLKEALAEVCPCLDRIELDSVKVSSIAWSGPIATGGAVARDILDVLHDPLGVLIYGAEEEGMATITQRGIEEFLVQTVESKLKEAVNNYIIGPVNQGLDDAGASVANWASILPLPEEITELIVDCALPCFNDTVDVTVKVSVSILGLTLTMELVFAFHYYLTQPTILKMVKDPFRSYGDLFDLYKLARRHLGLGGTKKSYDTLGGDDGHTVGPVLGNSRTPGVPSGGVTRGGSALEERHARRATRYSVASARTKGAARGSAEFESGDVRRAASFGPHSGWRGEQRAAPCPGCDD